MVKTVSFEHVVSLRKKSLIEKAKEKTGTIYPTAPHKGIYDGFTYEKDEILFWYNDRDGSTLLVREIEKGKQNAG